MDDLPGGSHTYMLVDANARLDGERTPFYGGRAAAEQDNDAGECLKALAIDKQIMLVNTFQGCEWTWRSHGGKEHRIDYIGVPQEMADTVAERT